MLAGTLAHHEAALRADLQRLYGVDFDRAAAGEHSASHVAALVSCLPADCEVNRAIDEDMSWSRTDVLLATLANELLDLQWMLGAKKGTPKPRHVGPRWMRDAGTRKLEARAMSRDAFDAQLARFRSSPYREVKNHGKL